MSVKLGDLMLDRSAVEGRWFVYRGDFEVLIASRMTAEYDEASRAIVEPYTQLVREGKMTQTMRDEIAKEVVATHVVKGWKNLVEADGTTEVPYSPQKALELFKDPRMYPFWRWVQSVSGDEDEFKARMEADAAKN